MIKDINIKTKNESASFYSTRPRTSKAHDVVANFSPEADQDLDKENLGFVCRIQGHRYNGEQNMPYTCENFPLIVLCWGSYTLAERDSDCRLWLRYKPLFHCQFRNPSVITLACASLQAINDMTPIPTLIPTKCTKGTLGTRPMVILMQSRNENLLNSIRYKIGYSSPWN